MRRLGEHMIDEIKLLQTQASIASRRNLPEAQISLTSLLKSLGLMLTETGAEVEAQPH